MMMQNKRLVWIFATVGVLLSLPLIAMQFTNEVNWSPADFIVAGVLLVGTGLFCELVMRKVKTTRKRVILIGVVLLVLLLVWIELAVGIFGTPFAGS